jgi:hypothetical protein
VICRPAQGGRQLLLYGIFSLYRVARRLKSGRGGFLRIFWYAGKKRPVRAERTSASGRKNIRTNAYFAAAYRRRGAGSYV